MEWTEIRRRLPRGRPGSADLNVRRDRKVAEVTGGMVEYLLGAERCGREGHLLSSIRSISWNFAAKMDRFHGIWKMFKTTCSVQPDSLLPDRAQATVYCRKNGRCPLEVFRVVAPAKLHTQYFAFFYRPRTLNYFRGPGAPRGRLIFGGRLIIFGVLGHLADA